MTFKISPSLKEEMDRIVGEHHFSNRTEFIRTAIREKIEKCKTVHFISKNKPKGIKDTSHRVREYTG